MSDSTFGMRGWVCPKCDVVMSPTYPTCFYCGPNAKAVKPEQGEVVVCKHERKIELNFSVGSMIQCLDCREVFPTNSGGII